ncbi:hypothetical protein TTHERM_00377370 (macronuclear) [Tetrahymena thermophila SB210]|uniref:Uncharacterized protein n=1 Tax=Tetrahymena thermophila (strain SB210) TaxID=312017 RepID=Q23FI1_TETTS|nr:hypothetical protein TTHERM_00377370 [Tetrahymena thermophila SB210]EAR95172.1 hypothetical protein TTHERM_00377370 [Tetrahymena thermophila SB210]|eukprot:XP_001015417.1 hypothetical protein TTHERM_00377370 [Tetrahymena thermophila SB210]
MFILYKIFNQKDQDKTNTQIEWSGEYSDVEINKIHIPIPTFANEKAVKQLQDAVKEVQNSINDHLDNQNQKNQILEMINEEFIKRNVDFIEKYYQKSQELNEEKKENELKSPDNSSENQLNQNPQQDNSGRTNQNQFNYGLIQKYKIYNQKTLKQYKNDLKKLLEEIIKDNQTFCQRLQQDINDSIKSKEKKQKEKEKDMKTNIKNPYLYSEDDYKIDVQQCNQILESIDNFGVDQCDVQVKKNKDLNIEGTITINFQQNKKLKTIIYSILYRGICQQEHKSAKKFIYKILGYIDPKSSGFQSENFILRQIFLHFLSILKTCANYKEQLTEFLKKIFKFEFISSLILNYLLSSALKILKKPKNADENEDIDSLARVYSLDLFLTDRKQIKKYKHKNEKYGHIIFIYFEQSLEQEQNQAIYFLDKPNDELRIRAYPDQQ